MTKNDCKVAVAALRALDGSDKEDAHAEADAILLRLLLIDKNGNEVANAFIEARDRIGFWYA